MLIINTVKQIVAYSPALSFVFAMIFFGWAGQRIVTQYLLEKQIRGFGSKFIFTLTFMCSVGLLTMYLYQISSVNIPEIFWDIMLSVLASLCVIVIPVCIIWKMPYVSWEVSFYGRKVPLLGITILMLYGYYVWLMKSDIENKKKLLATIQITDHSNLNIIIEIVVNLGVYIMAIMSAYGSVWCPYFYFNYVKTQKNDLIEAKRKTKDEIHFIIDQIKSNKLESLILEEKEVQVEEKLKRKRENEGNLSLFGRGFKTLTNFVKDTLDEQLKGIRQKKSFHVREIETLKRVHQQNFDIYKELVDEERKHFISETNMGKLFKFFSFLLSIYSITKILLTAWNMIVGRKLSTDPITRLLAIIEYFTVHDVSTNSITYLQYISFGFMGYLMISSVRSFSMNVKNLFDFIFRNKKLNLIETDTIVYVLSLIYGIYFLSAVILLQSGLPRAFVTNLEHITGRVNLVQHFTLFDKLFFWGCLLSAVFILFCEYHRKLKMSHIMKERNVVKMS